MQVLDDGSEINDDAGMEYLGIPSEELGEGGFANAELAEVVEDGDHVLLDTASEDEGVVVDVVKGEAEGMKEIDAIAHDFDGDGELQTFKLVGDDADGAEEVVDAGAVLGALDLHLLEAGASVEGGRGGG